jgi:hypothetical protein
MRTLSLASASVAALALMALYDATPAEARGGGRGMSFSSSSHAVSSGRSFARVSNRSFARSVSKPSPTLRRAIVHHTPHIKVAKIDKGGLGKVSGFVHKSALSSGKLNVGKLPLFKAAAGNSHLLGRLNVPKNLTPKLALAHAPGANLHARFAPFVQRNWKKAFFWVSVAGIGYLTVPEFYYDRFYRCASVDDPDYDDCIKVLSLAALEEEDEIHRVRHPMPSTATYRYSAKVEPTTEARQTCSFAPFVERKWNREFVWVQIPQTGNVTVPEEYYDLFTGKMGTEPPDFSAACNVLVEAAAADTVVAMSSPDLNRRL